MSDDAYQEAYAEPTYGEEGWSDLLDLTFLINWDRENDPLAEKINDQTLYLADQLDKARQQRDDAKALLEWYL